jgi:hypothetical protein
MNSVKQIEKLRSQTLLFSESLRDLAMAAPMPLDAPVTTATLPLYL